MLNDALLLLVLVVAIGVGWWLGKRSTKPLIWGGEGQPPSQYYRGLNFLLDGRQDYAIDAFTRALEVNAETFDTHIALGNVLRRRGEVERAIRVHQNLLARPSLPQAQLHLAHLELARDYISAGLLDRAEKLLIDLVVESGNHRRIARRHLLEIYEAQSDWAAACEVAEQLLPKRSFIRSSETTADEVGQPVGVLLAHYCCEQAEQSRARGDFSEGRELLTRALRYDKACVRATLSLGALELSAGQPERCIKVLKGIFDQAPDYLAETTSMLEQAMEAVGRRAELRDYLQECFRVFPTTPLSMAIAQELRTTLGHDAAKGFLRSSLREKPSLRGVALLMSLHNPAEAGDDETLELETIEKIIDQRSSYRCTHCGYRSQELHWYCPGCKHWGKIKDLGTAGEGINV